MDQVSEDVKLRRKIKDGDAILYIRYRMSGKLSLIRHLIKELCMCLGRSISVRGNRKFKGHETGRMWHIQ